MSGLSRLHRHPLQARNNYMVRGMGLLMHTAKLSCLTHINMHTIHWCLLCNTYLTNMASNWHCHECCTCYIGYYTTQLCCLQECKLSRCSNCNNIKYIYRMRVKSHILQPPHNVSAYCLMFRNHANKINI